MVGNALKADEGPGRDHSDLHDLRQGGSIRQKSGRHWETYAEERRGKADDDPGGKKDGEARHQICGEVFLLRAEQSEENDRCDRKKGLPEIHIIPE